MDQIRTREVRKPRNVKPQQQQDDRLPVDRQLRPAPAFHLGHYPDRWEWFAESGFLPCLVPLPAVAGINGNTYARGPNATNGPVNMNGSIQGFIAKGGTYIRPSDDRLGQFRGYADNAYENKAGELHHVMPWEAFVVLPGGQIKPEPENYRMWQEFRAHLRDSGIVDPIHRTAVLAMIERRQTRLDRIASRPKTDKGERDIARLTAEIEGITAAWDEIEAARYEAATSPSDDMDGPPVTRRLKKTKTVEVTSA